jgi:hypothetical protein
VGTKQLWWTKPETVHDIVRLLDSRAAERHHDLNWFQTEERWIYNTSCGYRYARFCALISMLVRKVVDLVVQGGFLSRVVPHNR